MSKKVFATERLYLTADKDRLVRQGDAAAAFLYCGAGHEIDVVEANRLGYADLYAIPEVVGPEPVKATVVSRPKPARKPAMKNKPKDGER